MHWRKRSPGSERSVISAGRNKYDFGMGRNSQTTGMVVNLAKSKNAGRDRSRVMWGDVWFTSHPVIHPGVWCL